MTFLRTFSLPMKKIPWANSREGLAFSLQGTKANCFVFMCMDNFFLFRDPNSPLSTMATVFFTYLSSGSYCLSNPFTKPVFLSNQQGQGEEKEKKIYVS